MQVLTMPSGHQESQGSGCGHNTWVNPMGGLYSPSGPPSTSISPMHEYSQFDFHPSAPMPSTIEAAYRIARPPPYASSMSPQMPPPLITNHNVLWPSMIASGVHPGSFQQPVLAAAPISTPLSAGTSSDATPTSAKTPSTRRKLTDEDRRQMCLEAEQNPNMKQTQIGAKFNVERSTVSKILRQREKYINLPPSDEAVSPGKKSKSKLPDFEKTLINWVRNQQRSGVTVSDDDLKKQARVFSFSRSDQALVSSMSWLEKFKQKNQLGNYAESANDSTATTHADTSPLGSPASSIDVKLPLSALETHPGTLKAEHDQYFDFDDKSDSMLQAYTEASPLSDQAIDDDDDIMTDLPATDTFGQPPSNIIRNRSQTLSSLENYAGTAHNPTSDRKPPMSRAQTTSLTLQSHVDPVLTVKRHKSVPDIHDPLGEGEDIRFASVHAPPLPHHSESVSPVSNPVSPTEDDNIKALHAIKKLLQENPGVADPDDYLAIGKLMEKMKILRNPTTKLHMNAFDTKGRKRQYPRIS